MFVLGGFLPYPVPGHGWYYDGLIWASLFVPWRTFSENDSVVKCSAYGAPGSNSQKSVLSFFIQSRRRVLTTFGNIYQERILGPHVRFRFGGPFSRQRRRHCLGLWHSGTTMQRYRKFLTSHIYICIGIYTYLYISVYIYIYIYVYIFMCIYSLRTSQKSEFMRPGVWRSGTTMQWYRNFLQKSNIYIFIYTYVYTYIHTYMYVYIFKCRAHPPTGIGSSRSPQCQQALPQAPPQHGRANPPPHHLTRTTSPAPPLQHCLLSCLHTPSRSEGHWYVCCSLLQSVAVCCGVVQRATVCCSLLKSVALYCSILQLCSHTPSRSEGRWYMCCSLLQSVAVVLAHALSQRGSQVKFSQNFSKVSSLLNLPLKILNFYSIHHILKHNTQSIHHIFNSIHNTQSIHLILNTQYSLPNRYTRNTQSIHHIHNAQ